SSANCMDKAITKHLVREAGVKIGDFVELKSPSDSKKYLDKIRALGLPVFVKPSRMGSSVGISKVKELSSVEKAIEEAFRYDSKVLIEKAIVGREIECAVLGTTRSPKVAIPGEIIPDSSIGWYSYEAKYLLSEGAKTQVPASFTPELQKRFQEVAAKVFQVLECDGLARVDFFLEKGTDEIYLNEVNTLPGFTPISMYPKMWQASDLSYSDLVSELLNLALRKKL
ncbi:MAG: D-alanine--D-alanine ligase, partial [Proteobacteria bacterium]|nr:D-alanine--D-alanine ligase [Pseudomonadota bacterium]